MSVSLILTLFLLLWLKLLLLRLSGWDLVVGELSLKFAQSCSSLLVFELIHDGIPGCEDLAREVCLVVALDFGCLHCSVDDLM